MTNWLKLLVASKVVCFMMWDSKAYFCVHGTPFVSTKMVSASINFYFIPSCLFVCFPIQFKFMMGRNKIRIFSLQNGNNSSYKMKWATGNILYLRKCILSNMAWEIRHFSTLNNHKENSRKFKNLYLTLCAILQIKTSKDDVLINVIYAIHLWP